MTQVLLLLQKIISALSTVLSLVGIIQGNTTHAAQENVPFTLETDVAIVKSDVTDPSIGLAKIVSNQAALLAAIGIAQTDILTAIANLTNGTTPVSLPPSPPSGYGGAAAADVWNYIIPETSDEAHYDLGSIFQNTVAREKAFGVQLIWSPFFAMSATWADWWIETTSSYPHPAFDVSAISPTDTLAGFLLSQNPGHMWNLLPEGSHYQALYTSTHGSVALITCLVDLDRFAEMKASPAASGAMPPIWPGLTGVTLGSPVALSTALTVTGPLAGVIIHVSSFAPRMAYGTVGALQGLRFAGAATFTDDNGQAERAVGLSFVDEVLMPRTMEVAATCEIRADASVVGTATPFTIP